MNEMVKVVIFLGVAVATAAIAHEKNRSPVGWFLFGLFVPGIALIAALAVGRFDPRAERDKLINKKCPQCSKIIKYQAEICRFCQYELPPGRPLAAPPNVPEKPHS